MEMLERDAALADMHRCLRQADTGHGLVLLVCGEAGVGKTSLLSRFLTGVDARVLLGRCDGVATPRPLAPLFDLNEPALTSLLLQQAPRDLLFRAVLERLTSLHATSILAIEDAHWADEATLDLLHYLGRRIAERRTLLILTFRDDDVGARHPLRRLLGDLATGGALHRVDLAPLSLAQVFDNDLNFKAIYDNVGNPWAMCISPGPHQYLFVSNSLPDNGLSQFRDITGEIYKMELDGTIVGKFGRAGKAPGEFATVHQMDCRDPDVIYTAEINNWRSQKILLKPQATRPSTQE
jgi:predicted ATPase